MSGSLGGPTWLGCDVMTDTFSAGANIGTFQWSFSAMKTNLRANPLNAFSHSVAAVSLLALRGGLHVSSKHRHNRLQNVSFIMH